MTDRDTDRFWLPAALILTALVTGFMFVPAIGALEVFL